MPLHHSLLRGKSKKLREGAKYSGIVTLSSLTRRQDTRSTVRWSKIRIAREHSKAGEVRALTDHLVETV
jgi:hypothetical protein